MCNIENSNFRKKPIVDFQKNFSSQENFPESKSYFY